MACPRAHGPMGQRRSCNDKQHFCSASLGQAFNMLLSSLLCPFTNKETEAPKANQLWRRVTQKLGGGGGACLLTSSPLASAGSLGPPPGGVPTNPRFFPSSTLLPSCVRSPLASCVLSSHPRAVPRPHPRKTRPLPQDMGREALLSSPPSLPLLHLYTPAVSLPRHNHHTGAGKEERPGEARQGWPDWGHSQLSGS